MTTYIRSEMVSLCDLLIEKHNNLTRNAGWASPRENSELKQLFDDMNIGDVTFDDDDIASVAYKNPII